VGVAQKTAGYISVYYPQNKLKYILTLHAFAMQGRCKLQEKKKKKKQKEKVKKYYYIIYIIILYIYYYIIYIL